MRNFVISLTSAHERREHIRKEFEKHNVKFEFFDALTPESANGYLQDNSVIFENEPEHLTPVELACMLSHIAIWQKAVKQSLPYITVFEDDIYLGQNAEFFLNHSKWLKPSHNIVKIETVNKKVILDSKSHETLPHNRQLIPLKSEHLGAGAYTLSLNGVKLLLNYILKHKVLPIDETLFRDFITDQSEPVYQMVPAICIQDIILRSSEQELILPSSLEEDRKNRMRKEKKNGLAKIRREANRLIQQAKDSLFAKEIPFR